MELSSKIKTMKFMQRRSSKTTNVTSSSSPSMTDNALMIMQHSREKGWNDTSQAEAAFDDESKKKKLDGESVEKQSPKKLRFQVDWQNLVMEEEGKEGTGTRPRTEMRLLQANNEMNGQEDLLFETTKSCNLRVTPVKATTQEQSESTCCSTRDAETMMDKRARCNGRTRQEEQGDAQRQMLSQLDELIKKQRNQ